jgi:hypothetical protein
MTERQKTAADYSRESEARQAAADRFMERGQQDWAEHERIAALTLTHLSMSAPAYVDGNVTPLRGA